MVSLPIIGHATSRAARSHAPRPESVHRYWQMLHHVSKRERERLPPRSHRLCDLSSQGHMAFGEDRPVHCLSTGPE